MGAQVKLSKDIETRIDDIINRHKKKILVAKIMPENYACQLAIESLESQEVQERLAEYRVRLIYIDTKDKEKCQSWGFNQNAIPWFKAFKDDNFLGEFWAHFNTAYYLDRLDYFFGDE